MANEKIGSKLKQLRIDSALTQRQVYENLKVPQSTFSSWEIGKSEPDAITFLKLCEIYKVGDILKEFSDTVVLPNADDFLVTKKEKEHIRKYRTLNAHGRKVIDLILNEEYAHQAPSTQPETINEDPITYNVIPFRKSEQPASAGRGTYLGPESFTTIMVEKNDLTKRALFGVLVCGDSMEPTYHNNDILIVEKSEEIQMGEIGVFTLDGEGFVKKCGNSELISLNPEYEPIKMNGSILLNGRVIGVLEPEWIVE